MGLKKRNAIFVLKSLQRNLFEQTFAEKLIIKLKNFFNNPCLYIPSCEATKITLSK